MKIRKHHSPGHTGWLMLGGCVLGVFAYFCLSANTLTDELLLYGIGSAALSIFAFVCAFRGHDEL